MNDDKDADVVVVTAVAMGCRAGRDGRVRIVFGEYDGSTILVLPESFFSSSLIDIFGRSHNHHKHHGYDRATANAWSGRSANHVSSRPGIHPLGLMMATAATTGTTITPAAPAPSGAVEVQIASRPVPSRYPSLGLMMAAAATTGTTTTPAPSRNSSVGLDDGGGGHNRNNKNTGTFPEFICWA